MHPTFEVSVNPLDSHEAKVGRTTIDKQFAGQLTGISGKLDLTITDGKHYYDIT